ncbi:hypothetical protein BGW42_007087 [Actinomortierella wolfii]|nr:hypothetical protein BGW42_007087 [Actinomortierella wolfii]
MPDIANDKRPREDDDTASDSNRKRLHEDLMQTAACSTIKGRREDIDYDVQEQQRETAGHSEAASTGRPVSKRRRSSSQDDILSRVSTPADVPEPGDSSDDATVHTPDPASPTSVAVQDECDQSRALALPDGSQHAGEESDNESIILIDLTSSSSRRQSSQPRLRSRQSRDSYPPPDSFPRVPYMEEQRGFRLPSMRSYMREYSRHSSQNTAQSSQQSMSSSSQPSNRQGLQSSQSSAHSHYHEVSDGEYDENDDEDYHDPYHPWAQGPVQLIMNHHGIPPTSSSLARTSSSVPGHARESEAWEHRIKQRRRLTDSTNAGSQGHRDAGVSLAASVYQRQVDSADYSNEIDEGSRRQQYEVDVDDEAEEDSVQVDNASIIAQGSDRQSRHVIEISDDSGGSGAEDDDVLSTQAQRSDNQSPIFLHASRSPSPVRVDERRTLMSRTHTDSHLSLATDDLVPPNRRSYSEEQTVGHRIHQNGSSSRRTSEGSYSQPFRVQPVPLILRRTPSAFTSFTSNSGSQVRNHSFMSGRESSSTPPRLPRYPVTTNRERSPQLTSPSRRHHANGRTNASDAQDTVFDGFRDHVPSASSHSSATVTPTATQATSRSSTVTPNTTQESMFTAPGSPPPAASTPSPSIPSPCAFLPSAGSPPAAASPSPVPLPLEVSSPSSVPPPSAAVSITDIGQQQSQHEVGTGDDGGMTAAPSTSGTNSSTQRRTFIWRLKCQICWDVPSVPTATQCGHVYCEECIHTWLRFNRECPVCRSPATNHSLQEMEFFVSNKI